jgi:hypothetical protein|tara:strand:+ start:287 stop:502 length:216 start_codon:yes stop_codon:yes gene_type:complete
MSRQRKFDPSSNRHYETMVEQGASAPCNGCYFEKVCKEGFTCEKYRKWEGMRKNEWHKNFEDFSQVPDMVI